MKTLALLLALALLPALAGAEEVWRWTDSQGTTHYTNRAEMAPADATPVKTRLIVEAKELPRSEPDLVLGEKAVQVLRLPAGEEGDDGAVDHLILGAPEPESPHHVADAIGTCEWECSERGRQRS